MKKGQFIDSFNDILDTAKAYGNTQRILLKLYLVEKISRTGTMFLTSVIAGIILGIFLAFLTFAFSFWYGETYGSLSTGFLISAGFYLVLFIVFLLLRRTIIENKVVQKATDIFLEEEYLKESENEK
jgi:hypothetical protein